MLTMKALGRKVPMMWSVVAFWSILLRVKDCYSASHFYSCEWRSPSSSSPNATFLIHDLLVLLWEWVTLNTMSKSTSALLLLGHSCKDNSQWQMHSSILSSFLLWNHKKAEHKRKSDSTSLKIPTLFSPPFYFLQQVDCAFISILVWTSLFPPGISWFLHPEISVSYLKQN